MELGWCGLEARRGWGIRQKKRWGQHRYHNRQIMIIINNPMILVIGNHSFFFMFKGPISLQASWHRGSGGEGVLQGIYQEGDDHKISSIYECFLFGQVVNFFIEVADAKKDEEAKKNLTELRDSPRTIEGFVKSFSYKDSKFKTICHADFWTSQIMFSLNEDGKLLSHTRSILHYRVFEFLFLPCW